MKNTFDLIPLTIETRGEIITNNLPEFRELVRDALANINRELKTDEDFEQAEKDVKALKAAEDAVRAAAIKAFDDQLKALVDGLNETAEDIRAPRLEIEKLIAKRKDEVKADLIRQAMERLDCAPRLRESIYGRSVADAVKGKRSFDGMSKALETMVTIHNGTIAKSRGMIETFERAHGPDLTMDREDLEVKSPDSVEGELRRRFESKKANEEKKRLEEEAVAARAAEAKAKAEAAAAEAKAKAEEQPATAPDQEATNVVPMKGMLPKSDLPQPPKIGSIPTGPSVIAEWTAWISTCKEAFAALKLAREGMRHPCNRERAAILANSVNQGWKEMQAATGEVEA